MAGGWRGDKVTRLEALQALLASPDAEDLPPRRYHYTQPGKHLGRRHRRDTLAPVLEQAYYQHQQTARHPGEVISVRRLKIVHQGSRGRKD